MKQELKELAVIFAIGIALAIFTLIGIVVQSNRPL